MGVCSQGFPVKDGVFPGGIAGDGLSALPQLGRHGVSPGVGLRHQQGDGNGVQQRSVRSTGEKSAVAQDRRGGGKRIIRQDGAHAPLQAGPDHALGPVFEQRRRQVRSFQLVYHVRSSSRPRACFHRSTRRQAASMAASSSVPFSTASMTFGIWVR